MRPRYDSEFRAAVAAWMPDGPDWRWAKAQGVQESGLDPAICSRAGACGIMQVMPGTWAEIERALGWRHVSRLSAHHSIFAGIYYQARMDRIWRRDRTIAERHALGLASYNSGAGSILAAQSACNNARFWPDIAPCLAAVTGAANARQTTDYVLRIARWRMEIKGCRWRGHRGGCGPGTWI